MSTIDETPAAPTNLLTASQEQQTVSTFITNYLQGLRGGKLGSLPIIIGLIILTAIFQAANSNFLSPLNLVNLIVQMSAYAAIAYGVVFVLLLGEIDLSIGYVSAVAGVALAIILRPPTQIPWFVALAAVLIIAAGIGLLHGWIITFFQVPSFVVTLAGLLAWNGVVLLIIGEGGTVIIQDKMITGIANSFLTDELGWLVAIVFVIGYAVVQFWHRRSRVIKNLTATPTPILVLQIVGLSIIAAVVVIVCNQNRGLPFVGVLIMILLIALTYLAENTRFGRYVYAVGGNKEAARRAGIKVEQVRMLVFMISSLMAGVGGVILASRLRSVATNSGGGNLLLNCIASGVIGGTSLFGGQGRVSNAVLGALVIAAVENGMSLVTSSAAIQFIITGLVLLAAVLVDALTRRAERLSGMR